MSDLDLTPLQEKLTQYASQGRPALLPALQAAQKLYGYLPQAVAAEVGRALGVPLADVSGVIDFYSMLYRQPPGKTIIRVCTDPACALEGAEALLHAFCAHLGVVPGQLSPDGATTVERAPCLGLCEHAPAVLVGEDAFASAEPGQVQTLIQGQGTRPVPRLYGGPRLLSHACDRGRPTSLDQYLEDGGYQALRSALNSTPQVLIDEVQACGLVGRGGAAFPTGLKWRGCAEQADQPKYVICNADESEPGTFKDRILLEGDPHRVLEGMLIAAYAVGASRGYIYIRAEYPNAYKVMQNALDEAQQARYLGAHILGSGFTFDVELRLGAGAYICGEETALFESIEGKRGYPRIKPPFPTTHGLFGKPTVINNVETLCNIPYIIANGAQAYRGHGTQDSPGTKLFCLSGDIARPGLYEIPFGVTLRYLLDNLAGGIPDGRALQAVLVGGAAGSFATPAQLDTPLSFEHLRQAGLPLGSGVLMVFDERRDLRDVLRRLTRFFAHESCGKCYPCQLGTHRQHEILERVAAGAALPGDAQRLADVGWTMSDASICGLGQTAATAVLSAMRLWPELFEPSATH